MLNSVKNRPNLTQPNYAEIGLKQPQQVAFKGRLFIKGEVEKLFGNSTEFEEFKNLVTEKLKKKVDVFLSHETHEYEEKVENLFVSVKSKGKKAVLKEKFNDSLNELNNPEKRLYCSVNGKAFRGNFQDNIQKLEKYLIKKFGKGFFDRFW